MSSRTACSQHSLEISLKLALNWHIWPHLASSPPLLHINKPVSNAQNENYEIDCACAMLWCQINVSHIAEPNALLAGS